MIEFIEILREYPQALQAVGVVGFLLYIGGFFRIQTGRLCGNGILFSITQVTAASCVLVSLVGAFNLASFLIQTSYIAIGLYGIYIRRCRVRAAVPKNVGADFVSAT